MATNEQAVRTIPKRTHSYNNAPLDSNNGRRNSNPVTPNDIHVTDTGIVREKQGKVYYNTNPEGAELISNGKFYTNADWSVSSAGGFSFINGLTLNSSQINSGGRLTYSACSQSNSSLFEIGKTYKLVIEGLDITSGSIELKFGRSHNTTPPRPVLTSSNNGTYEDVFTALNQNDGFTINSNGNTVAYLRSISIKEVVSNTESLYLEVLIRDEFNNLVSMLRNSNEGDISTGSYENNQGVKNRPVPRTKTVDGRTSRNIDSNGQPTL